MFIIEDKEFKKVSSGVKEEKKGEFKEVLKKYPLTNQSHKLVCLYGVFHDCKNYKKQEEDK